MDQVEQGAIQEVGGFQRGAISGDLQKLWPYTQRDRRASCRQRVATAGMQTLPTGGPDADGSRPCMGCLTGIQGCADHIVVTQEAGNERVGR